MGQLRDRINARIKGEDVNYNLAVEKSVKESPVAEEIKEQAQTAYYNRSWVGKVALMRGYAISQNDAKVDGILAALNRRNGHCPCGGNGAQFLCPCEIMRNNGICKCGLFENVPDRQFSGSTGGRIEK